MSATVDSLPSVPEAVSWSEGMLLSPQHFQQNDIYWNALLRHQLSVLQPFSWGLLKLSMDMNQLVKGIIVIERLYCVMDDGLLFDYPGYFEALPLTLDLSKQDWVTEPCVKVHLRVPIRGKGAASQNGALQRYTTVPGDLEADENTGKDEIAVQRVRPKMDLVAGSAVAKCYSSFPLFELQWESQGIRLTTFHPPMLRLEASLFQRQASLQAMLKELSSALWAKYRELLGNRANDKSSSRASDLSAHAVAARHLVMALPAFDVMLTSGCASPYDFYLALAQIVGIVASIDGARSPPALGAYDHWDCMPQFTAALDYVNAEVACLNADFDVIEFKQVGAGSFKCALPMGVTTDSLLIELQPRAGQTVATLGQWIDSARIATDGLITTLVRRRDPGAVTRPASTAQAAALHLPAGAFVYVVTNGSIELDSTTQPLLVAGRTVMIMGEPDNNVPAAITLYLPRAQTLPGSSGAI